MGNGYSVMVCGSKWIGEQVLRAAIAAGLEVAAVRCPAGRDKLRAAASSLGIPVSESGKSVLPGDVPRGTDLIACAGSFEYVSPGAIEVSGYGAVGYHPSLLPRFKGRRSVEETIASGFFSTGGSIYLMDSGYDTGKVLLQEKCDIPCGSTATSLWRDVLGPLGVKLYKQFFEELIAFGPLWDNGYIRAHYAPQSLEEL